MADCSAFYLALLSGLALAQPGVSQVSFGEITKTALKPVTVCEVLRNPSMFVGQNIAVLGRADSDDLGLSFFLVEDHCQPPLRTGEFVWPNKIWVDCGDAFIPGSAERLLLDESALRIKLNQLRRSTPLLTRKKIKLKIDGDVGRADGFHNVKDFWEVAFGRVEMVNQLDFDSAMSLEQNALSGFGDPPTAPVKIVLRLYPVFIDHRNKVMK